VGNSAILRTALAEEMSMVTSYAEISKSIDDLAKAPNLADWSAMRADWSWDAIAGELDLPDGKYNLGHECIDRHAAGARATHPAMIWQSAAGDIETYTYEDMRQHSNRFANALVELGIERADRVFFFADRIPELYFAVFGTLKAGAVVAPLFSAFGPEPVKERIQRAEGSIVVTTPKLLPKLNAIRGELPSLKHVIVIAHREGAEVSADDLDYLTLTKDSSTDFETAPTGPDDWSVMHFTSGTTGLPKGAAHVHRAVIGHYATGKYVLDFHEDDVYWCTADPGWVTGTSYGMFAPFSNGVTSVIDEGGFGAGRWYDVIQRHGVNVWYTAPTAIRLLMKAGSDVARARDLSSLRYVMSVGEPLNPEGVVWGQEAFDLPIHDNWWQTETGAIMIANYPSMAIRPGSMGRPFPGIHAAIIDDEGNEIGEPMTEGALAVKPVWPSMFKTYWNDTERYESRFQHGWYITGDKAKRDEDGYFWFVGRDDDVINTAGHLVSPFEVESCLIEHEAVAEAGVIGKPDPTAMEIVKAFVTLNDGQEPTNELRRELIRHCRDRLGAGTAPREIEIIDILPKTRSGKIMRRLLKARELGLPEGDTSTLEDD
jgi:acetyl-CoA synthetase